MDWAQPYGPLIETGVRVPTWNVWGDSGPPDALAGRAEGVARLVGDLSPDVVAMQEYAGQAAGLGYGTTVPTGPLPCAVLSRWPVTRSEERELPCGAMPGRAVAGGGPEPASDHYAVLAELRY